MFVWLIMLLFAGKAPEQPISSAAMAFDASKAMAFTEAFAGGFPRRVFGKLESRPSTGYLHDHLSEMGYMITYSHFEGRVARRKQVGRNVIAFKPGQTAETIALIAHFDTAPTTIQGASDNGAGVGILLEIARIFSTGKMRKGLLIVFSDAGEWGSLGAKDLAESYHGRNRIAAAVSVDHVNPGDLAAICLEETGQMEGFSPPWLRQLAFRAAESEGLPVKASFGAGEHFERTFMVSESDQGPLLRAGIPAINLGARSTDPDRDRAIYHSAQDTLENLEVASLEKFGRVVERIVVTLDDMTIVPRNSPQSFRLRDARYWTPRTVTTLHLIAFLPLAVILGLYGKDYYRRLNAMALKRELLVCFGTFLPFWAIYLCVSLVKALRLLPVYSFYPATAKDPVLLNPPWNILGSISATAILVAVVCYAVGRFAVRSLPKPDFVASKLILLGVLLLVAVVALIYNSFWATTFLLLPTWVWALVERGGSLRQRLGNAAIILAAGIPSFVILWLYFDQFELGWSFVWYQVLAMSSGLFTTTGCYLGIAGIVLGTRFLVIQLRPSSQ
jgi:hypothetical protein